MGFPRQEYWSGLPFPPSGDLPDPGIEPKSLISPALACGFFTTEPPGKSSKILGMHHKVFLQKLIYKDFFFTNNTNGQNVNVHQLETV